jgi:hypothetical protein
LISVDFHTKCCFFYGVRHHSCLKCNTRHNSTKRWEIERKKTKVKESSRGAATWPYSKEMLAVDVSSVVCPNFTRLHIADKERFGELVENTSYLAYRYGIHVSVSSQNNNYSACSSQ